MKEGMMMNKKTKYLVTVSLAAALAMILLLFRVSLPFLPPFYQLDFSESVVILAGYLLNARATLIIQLLKNILKILVNSTNTAFVGDVANFIMGVAFVYPAVVIYKIKEDKKSMLIGLTIGIISLIIVSCLVNYYIILPAYAAIYQMPIENIIAIGTELNSNITNLFTFVLFATAPFNLIKGTSSALIVMLVWKNIKVLFKK
jgi:riboflavin transporter FmnP